MDNKDTLVMAAMYDHPGPANIALGILRSAGIPCILDNEINNQILGIQLCPNNGIRLMVHASDLEAALPLIKDVQD